MSYSYQYYTLAHIYIILLVTTIILYNGRFILVTTVSIDMNNQIELKVKREEVATKVEEALELAEEYDEGRIVIQLLPSDDDIIVTHQLGNSWESMGLNASESEDRILKVYDCRDFEYIYWEGEDETDQHRILPFENSDYEEQVDDVMTAIEEYLLSQAPENSEIVY